MPKNAPEQTPEPKLIDIIPDRLLRLKIPMELPAAPGEKPVVSGSLNCYLIRTRSGRWAVIDTGFASPAGFAGWRMAVSTLGIGPKDIEYIILTHYHPDHAGMAGWFESWTDAPIYLHSIDIGAYYTELVDCQENTENTVLMMRRYGMEGTFSDIAEKQERVRGMFVEPCAHIIPMEEGAEFPVYKGSLKAVLAPGHTAGQCVFLWPEEKYLFAADLLLPVTFSPVCMHPYGDKDPIGSFIAALDRFLTLDIGDYTVLPGHGWPFDSPLQRAAAERQHYLDASEKYLEMCAAGANTPWLAALNIQSQGSRRRLRSLTGESIAYYEYLYGKGRLQKSEDGGVFRFRLP
ncbi:MAG: MBL fold metallo-hydrolase [Oscillospiraceae bacterium]